MQTSGPYRSSLSWATLPPEVLLHIFSFLPGDLHRKKPTAKDRSENWRKVIGPEIRGIRLAKDVHQPDFFLDEEPQVYEPYEDEEEEEQEVEEQLNEQVHAIADELEDADAGPDEASPLGSPPLDASLMLEQPTGDVLETEAFAPSADAIPAEAHSYGNLSPTELASETNRKPLRTGDEYRHLLRLRRQYILGRAVCKGWKQILDRAPFWRQLTSAISESHMCDSKLDLENAESLKMTPFLWSQIVTRENCFVCLVNQRGESTSETVALATPYFDHIHICPECHIQLHQNYVCTVCLVSGTWLKTVDWPVGSCLAFLRRPPTSRSAPLPAAWQATAGGPRTRELQTCENCREALFYDLLDLVRDQELGGEMRFASRLAWPERIVDSVYEFCKIQGFGPPRTNLDKRSDVPPRSTFFDFVYDFETLRWLNCFPEYPRNCWVATVVDGEKIIPTHHFRHHFTLRRQKTPQRTALAQSVEHILGASSIFDALIAMKCSKYQVSEKDLEVEQCQERIDSKDRMLYGEGIAEQNLSWGKYLTVDQFAVDTIRQGRWSTMAEYHERLMRSMAMGLTKTAKQFLSRVPPTYLWDEIDRHVEHVFLQTFHRRIKEFVEHEGNQFEGISSQELVTRLLRWLKERSVAIVAELETHTTVVSARKSVELQKQVIAAGEEHEGQWVLPGVGIAQSSRSTMEANWNGLDQRRPSKRLSENMMQKKSDRSPTRTDTWRKGSLVPEGFNSTTEIPIEIELNEYGWGLGYQRAAWLNRLCRSSRKKRSRP